MSYTGIVKAIHGNELCVEMLPASTSCDSCRTRNLCRISEKERTAQVPVSHPERYKVGQSVIVVCGESLGMKAVLIAFGLPLVLIVLALAVSMGVWNSEKLAVLIGLAVFFAYWTLLFLLRDRIGRKFSCRISGCRQL